MFTGLSHSRRGILRPSIHHALLGGALALLLACPMPVSANVPGPTAACAMTLPASPTTTCQQTGQPNTVSKILATTADPRRTQVAHQQTPQRTHEFWAQWAQVMLRAILTDHVVLAPELSLPALALYTPVPASVRVLPVTTQTADFTGSSQRRFALAALLLAPPC